MNKNIHTIVRLVLLIVVAYLPAVYGEQVTLDAKNLHWSRLEFKTYLLFIKLTADVEYRRVDSNAVAGFYNPADKQLVVSESDELLLLTMNSDNFGRKSVVHFWFDPDLAGLQTEQIESGRKNYVHTYRFGKNGVYRRDVYPKENESDLPRSEWTKLEYHEYPYPSNFSSTSLTDSAALFYIVSAANLSKPGDTFTCFTFGKKHLNKIELKVEGLSEIDVDYYEQHNNNEREVEETVSALRISVIPTPVGDNNEENEFEFLGLKEDIKIYVDPRNRIPLQISSRVKILGTVDIKLGRAKLQ
ncbi:DUF3108 domain-containing protein [Kaarinaea lacus]